MTERVLLLASHAVAEYDDVRMFTDLGYDIFAPGGYEVPGTEGEGIRPPLPHAPAHPDLVARLNETRAAFGDPGPLIDAGKARLHDDIIDWADVIICHHFPERWIGGQWDRIAHKRVIWRTCGQSSPQLEQYMFRLREQGMEIVRYSPAEERHYSRTGTFAGQDALIRFGKYPDDYGPWIGDNLVVGNVTQDMVGRGDACGLGFWLEATTGLPVLPAGQGSEQIGGVGILSYEGMLDYLRHLRVYLYTGTRPASYTLGLIEAMLSGVPVVTIGARDWGRGWGGEDLFEAHEIIPPSDAGSPEWAKVILQGVLSGQFGEEMSVWQRQRAIELFGIETVGRQWLDLLGSPARANVHQSVTAA